MSTPDFTNMEIFLERLEELIKSTDTQLMQLAADISVPYRTFFRYLKGEREIPLRVAIALADYFGVSIDYLVGRTDDPKGGIP